MNFLEICNKVNLISGIQGSLSDVTATQGIQAIIVESVRNGWITLQNYRRNWTFMVDRVQFSTVAGKEYYAPNEVFGVAVGVDTNLGHYLKTRMMKDNRPLQYIRPYDYPLIDNTIETEPRWFTTEDSNNYVYMQLPNDIYNITAYYIKKPQVLSVSTDIPDIPGQYHDMLVYKGIELLAVHIGNSELYQKYSIEYTRSLAVLLRTFTQSTKVPLRGGIA